MTSKLNEQNNRKNKDYINISSNCYEQNNSIIYISARCFVIKQFEYRKWKVSNMISVCLLSTDRANI